MKYPLIEKLKISICDSDELQFETRVVCADDLENLLESATVVYGQKYVDTDNSKNGWRVGEDFSWQTHKALLLAIEPIEQKKVTITRDDLETAYKNSGSLSFQALTKELGL